MTTWYDAQQSIVEAANNAMDEIANDCINDEDDIDERLRYVWEPVANALATLADTAAIDLPEGAIGITSDTSRAVSWGHDIQILGTNVSYRRFLIVS